MNEAAGDQQPHSDRSSTSSRLDGAPQRPTIGNSFIGRRNSLNALRLALAVLVIVSHSWPIGGYGPDPGIGETTLGSWAVAGFFAISGYLITASRVRSRGFGDYLWRRALRIYPAFIVVLLVVGFGFAPLSVRVGGDGSWSPGSAASYVLHNAGLRITQIDIPETLGHSAFPLAWNGSLWTLWYEFLCYLAIGIVVSIIPIRYLGIAALLATTVCALGVAAVNLGLPAPTFVVNLLTLGGYFAAGAVIYFYRSRIPLRTSFALASVIVIVLAASTSTFQIIAGIPVAYLIMWLGITTPFQAIGAKNDISYGMYIYAFPVQQTLALLLADFAVSAAAFVAICILATTPLALASWLFIEKPAMKLKFITNRGAYPQPQ